MKTMNKTDVREKDLQKIAKKYCYIPKYIKDTS